MPSSNTGPTSSRPGTSISENNIYSRITPFYVGGHTSKSRNPKIFELFTRMDLVERVGSGIPRIAEEMKAAGLPAPEYKTEGFFVTTLYKAKPVATVSSGQNDRENDRERVLNQRQKTILSIIKDNGYITTDELRQRLKTSIATINRDLLVLKRTGHILREGPDKGGRWVILDKK